MNLLKLLILISILIISIPGILFSHKRNVFINNFNRKNVGGPRRFLFNFNNYLNTKNIKLRNLYLGDVKYLFILSNPSSEYIYIIAKILNLKIITRVDGFYTSFYFENNKNKKKNKFQKNFNMKLKKALLKSDFVIYQSLFSKKIIDKEIFFRHHNYTITLNPVNTHIFFPKNKKNKKFNILLLGVWRDINLLKYSLKTTNYLDNKSVDSINIIGPFKNNIKNKILNYIKEKIVTNIKINFIGQIQYQELKDKINDNSLLLHLKSGDWCPNSVIESMSCGLPVVCQDYGGVKEIVGDAGVIINYQPHKYDNNLSKLAAGAILEIYENYEKFSFNARNRAVKNHDIDIVCSKYHSNILNQNE